MVFAIRALISPDGRAEACERVLRALPDWFGIEESIVDYVRQSRDLDCFAAAADGVVVDFAAMKFHANYSAELAVMGVLVEWHRCGVGRALVAACEALARERGAAFLTVKTLADLHPDEGYARTRAFYRAMGFVPLEVFPMLWDEANPCLLMAKCLHCHA